jgi:hypothetical protein
MVSVHSKALHQLGLPKAKYSKDWRKVIMSDTERMLNELRAYDDYRLNLLAQAILQLNEKNDHEILDPTLEMRLYENFQYNFGEDYEE